MTQAKWMLGPVVMVMVLAGCGDNGGENRGCDNAPDYLECVGNEQWDEEINAIRDEVDVRNDAHQDPETGETHECGDSAVHTCSDMDNTTGCLWTGARRDNRKPYLTCSCALRLDEFGYEQMCQ